MKMMKFIPKIILTITLILISATSFNGYSQAQSGAISPTIGVSPAKVLENVIPGKVQEFTIKLHNYGQDPLPLSGSATGIATIQDSGTPVFTDQISPHSAASWLEVIDPDIILASGEQRSIKIKATPPKDLIPGSYHAAVIFQAKLPSFYFDLDSSTRVLPAISVLFFLTVISDHLPTVSDLTIQSVEVPKLVVSTPLSITANIKNSSNFYIQADAKAQITGGLGSKNHSDDLGRVIILPDGTRKFVSAYSVRLLPGIYTASVVLKQGDVVLVASSKFVALPWQFILILLLGTFTFFFIAFRRRFRQAFQVLIGRESHSNAPNRLKTR